MRWYASSRSIFAARPATSSSSEALSASSRISSADSYRTWRAMVTAQSMRRSSTRGAERYSSGSRSKASSSAVVPRSRAAISYSALAWPTSFWEMEEKATSSSRNGAIPVHSESRQPRISSSSAYSRSARARSLTRFLQLDLQGVAVHAVVIPLQLVDEVRDLVYGVAPDDPQRLRLLAAAVELARVLLRELVVRRLERSGVGERLSLSFLPEDLVDQAAFASTILRTHSVSSRFIRRSPSRSCVFGPCPVTTCFSSSQSGSVKRHSPVSSSLRSSGSGTVRPSSQICGT